MTADMHTHSSHSQDSTCPMEEMCLAQIKKGTNVMAVTDHFNTRFPTTDDFLTIRQSFEEAENMQKKFGNQITVLKGIEIGEAFWDEEKAKKALSMLPYDVVIGSVHMIRGEGAYSPKDFGKLSDEELQDWLKIYFSDMLVMLEKTDFDILAHLTCPIRYITGKFGRQMDLKLYQEAITEILKQTIKKEKALEINTSAFFMIHDFMPDKEIIKQYYDMGGRLITLGSDAHVSENASTHFDEAKAFLKKIGFTQAYYYQNRTPVGYAL